jgi:N-dimethylarginine dimethylaminohydrolase
MPHGVLLGDPAFFRIKSGANPYTRNRWGWRKRVDRKKACEQWTRFRERLESLGARVFVLPPAAEFPGLVFPANAGFLHPKYEMRPMSQKIFCLSNLTRHRAGEQEIYRKFFSALGCQIRTVPYAFEGEADFFPCGEFFIFTYGRIVPTGFRPRAGWPPWYYQCSHRSDERSRSALEEIVKGHPVIPVRLTDPKYYHGDTALFAFGPKRDHLFAYPEAMDGESRERLKKHLGNRLVPLSRADTEKFVANCFQMETREGRHVLFPEGVSREVTDGIRRLGLTSSTVDVSEFFQKGGGSIKCLLCDLGPVEGGA